MARIVCQVLHRADRVTFLWSEGSAAFEPYHLDGAERARLLEIAGQCHAKLADGDGPALAQLGQRLHRAVFRLDAGQPGAAAHVHAWVNELAGTGKIESIEFLTDRPGLIPWNLLLDDAAAGDPWPRFFGARFNLGAGRRVNILRQNPVQTDSIALLAADLDLVEQLGETQKPLLNSWREAGKLVHVCSSLADELKKGAPDILLLLVRCKDGKLHLGADAFGSAELQSWLEASTEGNPDPIIILMGCGERSEQTAWQALVSAASTTFNGLVANETLLPASQAFAVGQALAQRFVEGTHNLGEILQTLRQEHPAAGLAFSAFCPPQLRAVKDETSAEPSGETVPLPEMPYRPFAAFDAADRALFFGREEDTLRGALALDQAATCGLLLHGSPAVGKTSYLQAGLAPFLEEKNVGYRLLRDRTPLEQPVAEMDYPVLILRATSDLAGQFADALTAFCGQPYTFTTPAGTQVTVDLPAILQTAGAALLAPTARTDNTAIQAAADTSAITSKPENSAGQEPAAEGVSPHELWIALRDNKDLLASILDAITRSLPFELVIVVDQGEELLTLVHTPKASERRQKALDMLAALTGSARCKIIFTLRSQFLGQFVNLLPGGKTPRNWSTFYLRPLEEAEMTDALLWPTNRDEIPDCDQIPHQKYGFAFEAGLAQQIVADAIKAGGDDQQSPLPILQAVGALLYEKQVLGKKQATLRAVDLKDFGGVKKALMTRLERSLEHLHLSKASQRALRRLIGKLYVGHTDGTLSPNVVPARELKSLWIGGGDPVETAVNRAAEEEGLFEIQQLMIAGQTDVYVSLPQDSLAQLGRKIDGERDVQAYARSKVGDVLWIMIPVAFLAAALAYYLTRTYFGSAATTPGALDAEVVEKIKRLGHREKWKELRPQMYYGQIARADEALRAGNVLGARQILLEQPATRSFGEDDKEDKDFQLPDLRGFEWKYLWRYLHSERFALRGHRGVVAAVAVSSDGKRAATAGQRTDQSDDAALRVWSLETGELLANIVGPKTGFQAIAFSADGKTLAAGGADKLIRLWDISKLKSDFVAISKEAGVLKGHDGAIAALVYGKDDKTLYSGGADKAVIVWDIAAGKAKQTLKEHSAAVTALALTGDGKTLASAGADGQLIVWDAEGAKKREAVKTAFHGIAGLAISQDGKMLAAGGVDRKLDAELGMVRFWTLADLKESRAPIAHATGVGAVAFGPDNDALVSGGKDFTVRLWNLKTGKEERRWIGHYGAIASLACAKDGSALISASFDGKAKVWDPEQSSGPDVIAAHADWVQCVALHPKNHLLASGSRDGSVKLWNPANRKLLLALPDLPGAVTALAFGNHRDKTVLAAATRDEKNQGTIKVWHIDGDAKQGYKATLKHDLAKLDKGVTCLTFHPSEDQANLLLSGGADHLIRLWDADAGKEKKSWKGHKDEVRSLAFSPDGRSFVSGGKDALVCTGEIDRDEVSTLDELHLNSIDAIAYVPLGPDPHEVFTGLLTGSADHSAAFWAFGRIDAGKIDKKQVAVFHAHAQAVTGILYSGKHNGVIVTCGGDGAVKLFDLFSENLKLLGHERYTFRGHRGPVRAIAMATDQSFLVSAGNDGTIRIWRAIRDSALPRLEGK